MSVASDRERAFVTNVLIDDNSAAEINPERGYPITFSQHAAILRPILCARPAAVLIDLTFRGVRSDAKSTDADDPELTELIAVLKGDDPNELEVCRRMGFRSTPGTLKPRIFISRTRSTPASQCDPLYGLQLPDHCRFGRQIDRLVAVAEPISVSQLDADGGYPLLAVDQTYQTAGIPLKMVSALCDRLRKDQASTLPAGCQHQQTIATPGRDRSPAETPHQHPIWSYYQSKAILADMRKYTLQHQEAAAAESRCKPLQGDQSILSSAIITSNELWHTLVAFGDSDTGRHFGKGSCLPLDTFSGVDVRQMSTNCGQDGRVCPQRLNAFFASRMVFYGVDITGINDTVTSHVFGNVPGSAYLATLAENLLEQGNNVLVTPREYFGIGLDKVWDFIAFLAATAAVFLLDGPRFRTVTFAAAIFVVGLGYLSLGFAWAGGLPLMKVAVAAGLLTFVTYSLIHKDANPPIHEMAVRFSIGVFVLMAFATISYVAFRFPPTNLIATMLLVAAIPSPHGDE